jgi:hypothetical protein
MTDTAHSAVLKQHVIDPESSASIDWAQVKPKMRESDRYHVETY